MGTKLDLNQGFFDGVLRSAGVQALCAAASQRVLAAAQATAPEKSGAYKRGLRIRTVERQYRTAYLVEGTAPHTMLVEARTGNLARALKGAGRG